MREMDKGVIARFASDVGLIDHVDPIDDPQVVGLESMCDPVLGDVGKYMRNENTE